MLNANKPNHCFYFYVSLNSHINLFTDRNCNLFIGYFNVVIKNHSEQGYCLRYVNENVAKQWDLCIIRTMNFKVNFSEKKCPLYTGKYGSEIGSGQYSGHLDTLLVHSIQKGRWSV